MERKLLSLPSFFVLLLIAGIAFLATPVVDVHADAPTATISRTSPTGTGEAPAGNAVYTIDFSEAVNETGTGTGKVASWLGFGSEDIIVMITQDAPPEGNGGSQTLGPRQYTLAKASNNEDWTVTVTVPTNSSGDISVTLKGADTSTITEAATLTTEASFTAATGDDHYATTTTVAGTAGYNTYDGDPPTVNITAGVGATGTGSGATYAISVTGDIDDRDIFQLEFAFSEALGTGDAAFAQADISIAILPATAAPTVPTSVIKTVAPKPDAAAATPTFIVVIDPPDDATRVTVGVKADAVTDANGNKLAATTRPITINTRPKVTITGVFAGDSPNALPTGLSKIPTTETRNIAVTLELSAVPTGSGNDAFQESDIAVTNGMLEAGSLERDRSFIETATVKATYTATVTLPAAAARKHPLTIAVAANSFTVENLGNLASNTLTVGVVVPDPETDRPPPAATPTGVGTKLTSPKVGFSFNVTVAKNGFVVLAKSPAANAGFTSAAGNFTIDYETTTPTLTDAARIDIADDIWVDLRHFLVGREGGSIDLIGPTGTAKVRDLVISEMMWGNDNGLSTPSDSQWIELYNTGGRDISNEVWRLEFNNKDKGDGILANDTVTTSADPVVDKLSTWRNVGFTWAWRIEDSTGGSHGQSGKSTLNSATSPGSPVELISMQRKIDYVGKVEKTGNDRAAQLKDFPNGAAAGSWEASKEHGDLKTYRKGTPGKKPVIRTFDKTGVPRGSVVFNEIANRSNEDHDWIELYNKSGSAKKINGWELSLVQIKDGKNDDAELFTFTSDNDINVPAKGYLLIVNTKPKDTTLEGGYNLTDPGSSERGDAESLRPYYVTDKLNIPKENFLLILRNGNDKTGTHEKIEDIAGHNPSFPDGNINTEVWPLRSWTLGAKNDLVENNTKTWVRDQGKDVFHGDEWKSDGGFTGVGIKRKYDSGDDYTSGTPGYANNAVQNEVKSDGLKETNPVIISEIMFATVGRAPQWIELHNPSHTQAVNLNKWVLEVFNYRGDELEVNDYAELVLPEKRIQPNQTVLIVSRETSRMSGSDEFPDDRIIGIWNETDLRKAFDMQHQNDPVLSSIGFHLKLSDPKKTVVDAVGNIDANRRNNDEPAWTLPDGSSEDGGRSSMVRDIEGAANDGTVRDAWRDADSVDSGKINTDANELYYGDADDVGTPGYTPGGVLPVQLSSFYSKRNDAGAVIITWSTESELDNAGFNLLRSSSRSGEFTKINAQLIPGAGTTGEKNTYTWTDTGAHPNVVYYYQIEDVSLDGAHRTLRTTRLRGHVGAHGKLTTTWGVLKSRD